MNDSYFDSIVNQCLWSYVILNYSESIKYICHDHNFSWAPQGYLLRVYLNQKISIVEKQQIKAQLMTFVVQITGLEISKVKIQIHQYSNSFNTL